jgi:hypothetical protein
MITPTPALPPQGGGNFFSDFIMFPLSPRGRGEGEGDYFNFSTPSLCKGRLGGILGLAGESPLQLFQMVLIVSGHDGHEIFDAHPPPRGMDPAAVPLLGL